MIKQLSRPRLAIIIAYLLASCTTKLQSTDGQKPDSWIANSDQYTQMLIDLDKKYSPEFGSSEGLAEYDTLVSIPTYANIMAERKEDEALLAKYKDALKTERDPHVIQDLKILIAYLELSFRQQDYALNHRVPHLNAATIVYSGLRMLLDDQTAPSRRAAAVVRIRKYAGLDKGYTPITEILKARTERQMLPADRVYPSRQEMEVALERNGSIVDGIEALCRKYHSELKK